MKMNHNNKQQITPSELRATFVEKVAPFVGAMVEVARGDSGKVLRCLDKDVSSKVWSLAEKIIASADDLKAMEANNVADVLSLLKSGKISVQDAKDLMEIMTAKTNIDMANKLLED